MRCLRGVARYGPWGTWLLVGILCGCTHGTSTTEEVSVPVNATTGTELLDEVVAEPAEEKPTAQEADKIELSEDMEALAPETPVQGAAAEPVTPAVVAEAPVVSAPASKSTEVEAAASDFQSGVAGAPMGPGLPEAGALMVYVVRPNDTLSLVAKRVYGELKKWKELASLSHLQNPNLIFPGDVLYYPLTEKTKVFAQTQMVPVKHQVVHAPHTTLASISKEVYGNARYWKIIWRENGQISNPFRVKKGEVVYYPAKSMLEISQNENVTDPVETNTINHAITEDESKNKTISHETTNSTKTQTGE